MYNCPECHVVMPRDVASGKIRVNRGVAAALWSGGQAGCGGRIVGFPMKHQALNGS